VEISSGVVKIDNVDVLLLQLNPRPLNISAPTSAALQVLDNTYCSHNMVNWLAGEQMKWKFRAQSLKPTTLMYFPAIEQSSAQHFCQTKIALEMLC
jgi:hypothetical protein